MARINVEDSIWFDPRFKAFAKEVGGEEHAIGCLVVAWRSAQTFFKVNGIGIPKPSFDEILCSPEMIKFRLAKTKKGFVYMCGSNSSFDWLKKKEKSGKLGGLAAANNRRKIITDLYQRKTALDSTRYPPTPTLPPSLNTNTKNIAPSVSKLPETLRAELGENLFQIFSERGVTEKQWRALVLAYPDVPWVIQEINRASLWEENNPRRRKKNFAAFINRWIDKGWDTRPIAAASSVSALPPAATCEKCEAGLIRARHRSSGMSEWCACSCARGRTKSSAVRFDEEKFERIS